jgi:nitronate monooxygenase
VLLELGYAGAQLGTRFIATPECRASEAYKRAIVAAEAKDVVLTERLTGVPVAGARHAVGAATGLEGRAARALHAARPPHQALDADALRAALAVVAEARPAAQLARAGLLAGGQERAGIDAIEPAGEIVRRFGAAARVLDEPPGSLADAALGEHCSGQLNTGKAAVKLRPVSSLT